MTAPARLRLHQFSLATLLIVMTFAALLARPAWREWQRWRTQRDRALYWDLFGRETGSDDRQRAAVRRGLEWLERNASQEGWQSPSAVGQSQESDL